MTFSFSRSLLALFATLGLAATAHAQTVIVNSLDAGAIGVVMSNNTAGALAPAGFDPMVTIPVLGSNPRSAGPITQALTPDATLANGASPEERIGPGVREAILRDGGARVVISLEQSTTEFAVRAPADVPRLTRAVAAVQREALSSVLPGDIDIAHQFEAVPAIAGTLRREGALMRLAMNPAVRRIDLDIGGTGSLATSVPQINADQRQASGNSGDGMVVAVLDSGIDSDHPDLADDIGPQACFGDNNYAIDGTGFCPNGSDRQTGPGSAEDDHGHGTHVSGIITSNGSNASVGVAPGATIVAVKVLDSNNSFFTTSEVLAGLDWIIVNNNAGLNLGVQVINMSLGTNLLWDSPCDNAFAFTQAMAAAVNTLRGMGVLSVVSSGNNGSGTQMNLPACLGATISVGAVDRNDAVTTFSNSDLTTDVFAPGTNTGGIGITSSQLGGGTVGIQGTSMAAPHVAGCVALLIESGDATTPDAIETRLETSAVQVVDPTNNFTFSRVDCVPDSAPPTFGYVPAPGVTVNASGGTLIGSTGSMTITPSVAIAGNGFGAGATTTLTCSAPTAPFSGFGQTVTAVGAGAISGGPLSGSCTLGAGIVTQTLTCNENRGGANNPQQWTLSCPAGTCPPTVVTNGDDSGPGSLRQIIAEACPGSTITFAPGVSTVTLTTAELVINKNLSIDGGAGVTVARTAGSPDFRIFSIGFGTTVSISGVTISNGSTTGAGGGIFSAGALSLSHCAITGNSAGTNFGGGIWSQGPTLIDRCTISGNQAGNAGGLFHGFNTLTMSNTTVSDNTTTFQGAGVNIQDATATLVNCTISGNRSTSSQAGVAHLVASRPASSLTLSNCTVTDNVGPAGSFGGVWTAYFTDTPGQTLVTRLENTIVANNLPGNFTTTTGSANTPVPTPNALLESTGHNLDSDGTSGFVNSSNGDLVGTVGTPINALLAPLGPFGGPTRTHALLPGSPAINAGTATDAPTTDQRGVARVGTVDIGAFESRGFDVQIDDLAGDGQRVAPGQMFPIPLTVSVVPLGAGEPVTGGSVSFTSPAAGAGATFLPNPASIDANGIASSIATANAVVGSYSVLASIDGGTGSAALFTLTNAAAELSLSDAAIVTEGDAATSNATFTVTRSNNLTAFSVPYSINAVTAQAGTDYTATSGTLSFAAGGALTQTISVPVIGDLIVEDVETATLELGVVTDNAGVTTITDGSGLLTITDNDSAVVAFNPVSVSQSEATSPMAFTVSLSNPVQSGVDLTLNSAFGSASAADFNPIAGGTVSFPANSNASQTVNVVINNDALDENDESFTLTLSGLTAVGDVTLGSANATGTIEDDDLPPVISITSPSLPEGNTGTSVMNFEVSLSAASSLPVTFNRATSDGSATVADNDYVAIPSGALTIPVGQQMLTIPVTINGDTVFEGDETFSVVLSAINGATPTMITGTGTIVDVVLADLAISKTNGATGSTPGTDTTYTIVASNAGPSDAPGSTVVDSFPAVCDGVTWSCAGADGGSCTANGTGDINDSVDLPVGASVTYTATCTIDPGAVGTLDNTASVAATGEVSDPDSANNSATDSDTLEASADISTVLADTPDPVTAGENLTYTVTAINNGPANAGNVMIELPLPAGTSFVSADGGAGAVCNAANPVTCSWAGTTANGASRVATIVAAVDSSTTGTLDATATGSSSTSDPNPGNNSGQTATGVVVLADLAISKTNGATGSTPGTDTTYTIVASNAGPSDAPGSTVVDSFPPACDGVTWSCAGADGGSCTANGTGDINDSVDLPVGASVTYTATCTIDPGAVDTLDNTASVAATGEVSDPDSANNTATDSDTLSASADVALNKVTQDVPDPLVLNSAFSYVLTASNAGPSAASAMEVSDTLPANLSYVSNDCGATFNAPTLTWNIATLGNGEDATCTLNVTVNDFGEISNSASLVAAGDPDTGNNSSTAELDGVPFPADVEISLSSTADMALGAGDSFTYTVLATNNGPGTALDLDFVLEELTGRVALVSSDCGATITDDIAVWTVASLASGDSTSCVVTADILQGGAIRANASVATSSDDPEPDNNSANLEVRTAALPVPVMGPLGTLLMLLIMLLGGIVVLRHRNAV